MAPNETDDRTTAGEAEEPRAGRRKAARYVVPVTVLGVAAATIGLVPALADSGDPDLPDITAAQLVEKIAQSDVERLSGTVKITTDLGLPNLGGLESGLLSGAAGGEGGSSADPSGRLHRAGVRHAHPARRRRRPRPPEAVPAGERRRVQPHPQWQGRLGLRQRVQRGLPRHRRRGGREGAEAAAAPATPKDFAEEALKAVDDTTSVKVDGTAQVVEAVTPTGWWSSPSSPDPPSAQSASPWTARRACR